ncbi:MAG: hypothetical protein ACJ8FY_17370 [Gemmataceae bacterium]
MSEVRFVVREADRDWSGTIHGSWVDHAVAALSSDPITLNELEAAVLRFAKPVANRQFFANLSPGLCDEPYDAGIVVIDFVARLVMQNSTYSSASPKGYVLYHDGSSSTTTQLPYHLADDWLFLDDVHSWRHLAEKRRQESAAMSILNVREVFYGRALLEYIAREVFAAFARRDEIAAVVRARWMEDAQKRLATKADQPREKINAGLLTEEEIAPKTWPGQEEYASPYYDTIKQIHAAWLLTPRDELGGACPREIALKRHGHLTRDSQDRCEQWSMLGECPPGLEETSHAFRNGGFGTHELVMYYYLIRELLWSCWEQLTETARSANSKFLAIGDFLGTEIPRLENVRETWLDAPNLEFHSRTPCSIIRRERARLPEGMSRHEAIVDADCPCCQMLADLPGPAFWHLDGCNMDDDFAFDIHRRTREEWEDEQRKWEEHSRRFNAEWAERERLGVTDSMARGDDSQAVWSRSFSVGDMADVPLGIRVFGVGCRLAEVITCLRENNPPEASSREAQAHIDQLNRDFGNLREILQNADSSLSDALLDPVLEHFAETLAAVARDRHDLAAQCDSLTNEFRRLLDPRPSEPSSPFGDSDIPF